MKRVIEYIPAFTILLILLGYLNLHLYYSFYGLDIYNFLDPTEILFSFSSIYVALIGFLSFCCLTQLTYPFNQDHPSSHSDATDNPSKRMTSNKFVEFGGLLFASCFLIGFAIISYFEIRLPLEIPEVLLLAFYFIVAAFIFFFSRDASVFTSEGKRVIFRMIFFFLLIVSYFYLRNYIAYKNTISGYPKYLIQVTTDRGTIKSSSDLIFIGGTRNFLFLYNKLGKEVIIMPKSEAEEMSLKNVRNGL